VHAAAKRLFGPNVRVAEDPRRSNKKNNAEGGEGRSQARRDMKLKKQQGGVIQTKMPSVGGRCVGGFWCFGFEKNGETTTYGAHRKSEGERVGP